MEVSPVLSGAGSLLVRWSIFSGPEVSLFFFILLGRFRGGLCVLFIEFLMRFCIDFLWSRGFLFLTLDCICAICRNCVLLK